MWHGCAHPGISLRTQELYTLVFVCRYLDLFFRFVSVYALSSRCCASPLPPPFLLRLKLVWDAMGCCLWPKCSQQSLHRLVVLLVLY